MQPAEHKGLKNAAALVFYIVLLSSLYLFYRYHQNPSAADLHGISDLSSLAASKCSISSGSFLGASGGTVYIHAGKIREDLTVIEGGEQKQVHRLFIGENNGTLYLWIDGATDGIVISDVYAQGGFSVADGAVSCRPWWIVNGNAFLLPSDVSFSRTQ